MCDLLIHFKQKVSHKSRVHTLFKQSLIESFNTTKHTPLYENEQIERKIKQSGDYYFGRHKKVVYLRFECFLLEELSSHTIRNDKFFCSKSKTAVQIPTVEEFMLSQQFRNEKVFCSKLKTAVSFQLLIFFRCKWLSSFPRQVSAIFLESEKNEEILEI